MEIAALVLDFVRVLAWPVVVVVLALAFKKQLVALFGRLTSAQGPGFAVNFAQVETLLEDESIPAEERVQRAREVIDESSRDPLVAWAQVRIAPRLGDVETFYRDDNWFNRVEGRSGLVGRFDSQRDAIKAGRRLAKAEGRDHVVRDRDGRIVERSSFSKGTAASHTFTDWQRQRREREELTEEETKDK